MRGYLPGKTNFGMQLFPVRNGILRGRNSIAYLENFDKYFSYGMSARHIAESDL